LILDTFLLKTLQNVCDTVYYFQLNLYMNIKYILWNSPSSRS